MEDKIVVSKSEFMDFVDNLTKAKLTKALLDEETDTWKVIELLKRLYNVGASGEENETACD